MSTENRLAKLMEIVKALPEAEATTRTGQHYAFEVRGKKFGYYTVDHHGDGRAALNLKAAPGVQQALVGAEPERFFVPAYLGPRGWLGLDLDAAPIEWAEVTHFLTDAYRLTAPKTLAARL